jgi:type II restriction enzyme
MTTDTLIRLIDEYKAHPDLTYQSWFLHNEDRLKAFRSIRRGVLQVVSDIKDGSFPNDFKGSSLEFVLSCITEQKQLFEGASHPFYWKPKLRIPDIYENQDHKRQFGQFLECCLKATKPEAITREIERLDAYKIKGLGPAVASILYFLHPTWVPPFNTAIINGYNRLFNERRKLGSWPEYLAIREKLMVVNNDCRQVLSNDLGALSGLLFEIGAGNLLEPNLGERPAADREKIQKQLAKRHKAVVDEAQETQTHSEMQFHLLTIGRALGYDVVAARNDRSRQYNGHSFSFLSLPSLPPLPVPPETGQTISLIDIIWLEKETGRLICAFEVEKSTSIYSGILRLTDLTCSLPDHATVLYLIVPDSRQKEVELQLTRPSIRQTNTPIRYILMSELRTHCDALCRFGDSHRVLEKIAKAV